MPKKCLDISVIIPFKDKSDLTIACLRSLEKYTHETIHEIILVSNNSTQKELLVVRDAASQYNNTTVLIYDHPFNYHKINNWAAKKTTGKVLLFLNNDVELFSESEGLLEKMYTTALKEDVGTVGAVLLYEDQKTIQHAGVYLIPGGTADHLYIGRRYRNVLRKINDDSTYYDIYTGLEVSAVTAAAVMIKRSLFREINGFNEDFIICGGDVDLCLRAGDKGKKSILTGSKYGYMVHKESQSRSTTNIPYVDYVESYKTYIKHFDLNKGDPFIDVARASHV